MKKRAVALVREPQTLYDGDECFLRNQLQLIHQYCMDNHIKIVDGIVISRKYIYKNIWVKKT